MVAWIAFGIGIFLGASLGIIACSLCSLGKIADLTAEMRKLHRAVEESDRRLEQEMEKARVKIPDGWSPDSPSPRPRDDG